MTDVPAFRWLRLLEEEFEVEFLLYGGAATRLAIALNDNPEHLPELVDLAPFSSDIDLAHSGPESLTPRLLQAIDAVVPGAGWCRWSLVGLRGWRHHRVQRAFSALIPLRTFEFSSARSIIPSDRALTDLGENRVTISVNPEFRESPFYRENWDLEIFSPLIAFGAVADLAAARNTRPIDPDIEAFVRRFAEAGDGNRLRRSFLLRRRLRYLMAALEIRLRLSEREPELWSTLSAYGEVELPSSGRALVLSASVSDATYRLPLELRLGPDEERLSSLNGVTIDNLFRVAGLSAPVAARFGSAASSGFSAAGTRREFAHLAWPSSEHPGNKFGVLLVGKDEVQAPYAIGGVYPNGYAWLRVDIAGMLTGRSPYLQFAVLEKASAERLDGTPRTDPIRGAPGPFGIEEEEEMSLGSQHIHGSA